MSDFSELVSEKFRKSTKDTTVDLMKKSKVKNSIMALINDNLKSGDELIFEVGPQDLAYTLLVVDEEPIKTLVSVEQVDQFLFKIKLRDVNLW